MSGLLVFLGLSVGYVYGRLQTHLRLRWATVIPVAAEPLHEWERDDLVEVLAAIHDHKAAGHETLHRLERVATQIETELDRRN